MKSPSSVSEGRPHRLPLSSSTVCCAENQERKWGLVCFNTFSPDDAVENKYGTFPCTELPSAPFRNWLYSDLFFTSVFTLLVTQRSQSQQSGCFPFKWEISYAITLAQWSCRFPVWPRELCGINPDVAFWMSSKFKLPSGPNPSGSVMNKFSLFSFYHHLSHTASSISNSQAQTTLKRCWDISVVLWCSNLGKVSPASETSEFPCLLWGSFIPGSEFLINQKGWNIHHSFCARVCYFHFLTLWAWVDSTGASVHDWRGAIVIHQEFHLGLHYMYTLVLNKMVTEH